MIMVVAVFGEVLRTFRKISQATKCYGCLYICNVESVLDHLTFPQVPT